MGARMTYYTMHVGVNLFFIFTKNGLKNQILNLDLFFPLIYILSTILATKFFLITGKRPGYVSLDIGFTSEIKKETEDYLVYEGGEDFELILEKNIIEVDFDEEEEKITPDGQILDSYEFKKIKTLTRSEVKLNSGRPINSFPDEEQNTDSETDSDEFPLKYPKYHYCRKCQKFQNFRTKHCHECQACVAKFDHHCFWVGGCVGELNHRLFWWMLFFMTIEYTLGTYYVILF